VTLCTLIIVSRLGRTETAESDQNHGMAQTREAPES
jgi:hypothetical protein